MSNILDKGFISNNNFQAIEDLISICSKDLLPYIKMWWESANNDQDLLSKIKEYFKNNPKNDNYVWLAEFLEKVSESIKFDNRNFLNIHPNPFIPSILANLIISIQNPNCVAQEVSRALWDMEEYCIKWLASNLIGFDKDRCWGNVVCGGTLANMTGLLVARDYTYNKLSRPRKDEIGARGVLGRSPGIVITSKGSHYSLKKAMWFLGMGYENLIQIPVAIDEEYGQMLQKEERFLNGIRDKNWRDLIINFQVQEKNNAEIQKFYSGYQRPFDLQPLNSELIKTLYSCFQYNIPLIACVFTFGTTFTGTIENLNTEALTKLLNEDIYIHIDAAWGGFSLVCPEIRNKASLLFNVDSVTIDGHKLGLLPYSSGSIIFKDLNTKNQIIQNAPYLENVAPTLEGSRSGTNIASLWVALKTIGYDGYNSLINKMLTITQYFAKLLEDSKEFQILHRIDLNAIAFAPFQKDNEKREYINELCWKIKNKINDNTKFKINFEDSLCGIKVYNNKYKSKYNHLIEIQSIRVVISNPFTEKEDCHNLINLLCDVLHSIRNHGK